MNKNAKLDDPSGDFMYNVSSERIRILQRKLKISI